MDNFQTPPPFLYSPRNAKVPPVSLPVEEEIEPKAKTSPVPEIPASVSVEEAPVFRSAPAPVTPLKTPAQNLETQNSPASDNEARRRAFVQLMHLRLPVKLLTLLLEKCRFDPEAVLQITDSDFEDLSGATSRQLVRLRDPANRITALQINSIERDDIRVLTLLDSDYPNDLRDISDPPPLLMQWGKPIPAQMPCVGMVGSRTTTPYGIQTAERFSRELAGRGCAIISGGAAGIDTAAHRGALAGGGATFAFLGCGVDVDYPRENRELFVRIRERGALFSEYAPGAQPDSWHFPARNRLISGTSTVIVVVEASLKSGALLTARNAGEQGRTVLAVPGNVDRPSSAGTNQLIRDGAGSALCVEDILREAGFTNLPARASQQQSLLLALESDPQTSKEAPRPPKPLPASVTEVQVRVLETLSMTPKHIDGIGKETGLGVSQMCLELLALEFQGLIQRLPGSRYIKVD